MYQYLGTLAKIAFVRTANQLGDFFLRAAILSAHCKSYPGVKLHNKVNFIQNESEPQPQQRALSISLYSDFSRIAKKSSKYATRQIEYATAYRVKYLQITLLYVFKSWRIFKPLKLNKSHHKNLARERLRVKALLIAKRIM